MAKIYALDGSLLVGCPEVKIGDKLYALDDRQKTVKQIMRMELSADTVDPDTMDEILKLVFGDKHKEIDALNLPFKAYLELFKVVMGAVTGQEPEEIGGRQQADAPTG